MSTQINNADLKSVIKASYSLKDLADIQQLLSAHRSIEFIATGQGLFPAAAIADSENTGYKYVWVRDNIFVAYAHYLMGDLTVTIKVLLGLMGYFQKVEFRFAEIINQPDLKEQVMRRPHIRFDGETLSDVEENWEHAQNDALGYFLWLYCRVVETAGEATDLLLSPKNSEMLRRFVEYFEAIRYWEDADSGHWEEGRKVSASSIGTVVAGLMSMRSLIAQSPSTSDSLSPKSHPHLIDRLSHLIEKGETALHTILPWECCTPENKRRYDAALLYLIYPLNVVTRQQAKDILADVKAALTGKYGIARYPYDSFWCRDFQDIDKSIQTAQYSGREAWLKEHNRAVKRGEEAQWCIFDPIISAIYGEWFLESGEVTYLDLQTHYLNRALGQITGMGNTVLAGKGNNKPVDIPAYRCPELYYLQQDQYVPNVSTPLLWTQANLCIALTHMKRSLSMRSA
ncbi:MAG: glycoside hydrolase family 15 protein [Cyanobacteria bacterium J06554_3]